MPKFISIMWHPTELSDIWQRSDRILYLYAKRNFLAFRGQKLIWQRNAKKKDTHGFVFQKNRYFFVKKREFPPNKQVQPCSRPSNIRRYSHGMGGCCDGRRRLVGWHYFILFPVFLCLALQPLGSSFSWCSRNGGTYTRKGYKTQGLLARMSI